MNTSHLKSILEEIKSISVIEPKSKGQMLVKLMEELGELSRASLREEGALSYRNDADCFLEELIDLILVSFSLFFKHVGESNKSDWEITSLFYRKIDKWLESIVAMSDKEGIPEPSNALVCFEDVKNKVARTHLERWMRGQTMQVVNDVEYIYPWDYKLWYDSYMKNKTAEVTD